jgi:hypothetical protein
MMEAFKGAGVGRTGMALVPGAASKKVLADKQRELESERAVLSKISQLEYEVDLQIGKGSAWGLRGELPPI